VTAHHHHALAASFGVVVLSLGAAFLYAVTSVLQHGAMRTIPSERSMRPRLLVDLIRHPRWLLSNVVDAGGYLLQFLALRAGSLVVVETLLTAGLLFALPLGAAASHRRPSRHDWLATLAVVLGLSGFILAGRPAVGAGNTSRTGWVITATAAGVLIAVLVGVAERGPQRWRAPVLGAATGVVFGLTAALAKASGHLLDRGVVHTFGSWQPYALAAMALFGVVISQSAFQAGPLQASLPMLAITEPLVAAVIGLAAFHEHIVTHGPRTLAEAAAIGLLGVGVVALSRSPLVTGSEPRPEVAEDGGFEAEAGVERRPNPRRRRTPLGHAVRITVGLGLAALAVYVVSGRTDEIRGAAALLEHARWPWLFVALPAEAASLLAYAALERRLLRAGDAPVPLGSLLNITLAGNAIQNSLPGGPAWAAGFAFGQFKRRGADNVLASWTLLATGFVSAAALVLLTVCGVAVARGEAATNDLVGGVVVVAVCAVALAVSVRLGLHARWVPALLTLAVRAGQRLVRRPEGDPEAFVRHAFDRLTTVRPSRADWAVASAWGVSNWLLDCACLAMAFPTVGAGVPWRGLLLAYGAGQLAANLPITPGGLGAVEGSLTVALVAYGGGEVPTVAAVLVYRIITFWLLLAVGWTVWLFLRWSGR